MHYSLLRIPIFLISMLSATISPQFLRAATFEGFDYVDNGTTITILKYNYQQTDISIPSTIDGKPVTAIAKNAFYPCRQTKSITIPSSVTTIGPGAFSLCTSLTNLTIPAGVSVIEEGTFESCWSLTNVTLPSTVTKIGKYAFYNCQSLKALRIPEYVTVINDGMFDGCFSLTDVSFSRNVTIIGTRAFFGCVSLTTAPIQQKLTALGSEAFASSGLTNIVIPDSLKSLGQRTFNNCLSLRKVVIKADLAEIDDAMFAGCKELTHVTLPDSVRKIGAWAFQECPLAEIDLKGVRQISPNAFRQCGKLNTVTLPKSLKSIGDGAFSKCGHLASAVFEGNAPKMGEAVFENPAPDFQIIVSDDSKHFTVPRWNGYRVSLPKEEITVQLASGNYLQSTGHTSKFGMVLKGKRSAPTVFTIRNVGNRKLNGLSARINGGDSQDFLIRIPMRNSLAPGKSTTIELVFKPKDTGKRQSTLQIMSSDASENPFEIKLSGVGLRDLN